jgi:hypothetical protein
MLILGLILVPSPAKIADLPLRFVKDDRADASLTYPSC